MSSADERYKHALYRQMHPDEYDGMETVRLFQALGDEGYGPAQAKMATFLKAMGKPEEAMAMLQKAVDQEYPPALTSMGVMYYRGDCGVEKSYEKAVEYYQKAAALEDRDGILNLGLMYEEGEGCADNKPDYQKASECYRQLTVIPGEEDVDACFHLACLCLQGKLGSSVKLKAEGMVMMREAAGKGHEGALQLLSSM